MRGRVSNDYQDAYLLLVKKILSGFPRPRAGRLRLKRQAGGLLPGLLPGSFAGYLPILKACLLCPQ